MCANVCVYMPTSHMQLPKVDFQTKERQVYSSLLPITAIVMVSIVNLMCVFALVEV